MASVAGAFEFRNKFQGIEEIQRFKLLLGGILQDGNDFDKIKILQQLIAASSPNIVETVKPLILSVVFVILKQISTDKNSFTEAQRQIIVEVLKNLFDKIKIEKQAIFFNIYGFLLFEAYDAGNHKMLDIHEDYKMCIVQCMTSLVKSLELSAINEVYKKENAPKLVQAIFVLVNWLKTERYKELRINCVNCLMAFAQTLDDENFGDLVTRNQVCEVFMFCLPGVAQNLRTIALSDEKIGHKLPSVALKAWGRIVTLLMEDYNASDRKINLKIPAQPKLNNCFKNDEELKDYVHKTERTPEWYMENDKRLQQLIKDFEKLTHHSHRIVRLELVKMFELIIHNCLQTMPNSIGSLLESVIALSEDDDDEVATKAKVIIENLSSKFSSDELKTLLENLEDGFYRNISGLPRKFNGIDEKEQLVSLNMLSGYISLFGKHSLDRVLYSMEHLKMLVLSLIHISEFDKKVSVLEEYTNLELETTSNLRSPWKRFRCFKDESIYLKIEALCSLLAKFGVANLVSDFLFDTFYNDVEHRKEATFLLNGLLSGVDSEKDLTFIKNLIQTYIESSNWYLPLDVMIDDFGYEITLGDAQNNITQVCLLAEGVGKAALISGEKFERHFMLKVLYLIFERAGSAKPLVRTAGLAALSNIVKACGYSDIGDLINKNMDYFSFHIERKFRKAMSAEHDGVLNVLAVMMTFSTIEVLEPTLNIIDELLIQSCDKRKASEINAYLNVFKMFIKCLHRWFGIEVTIPPLKSKKQKQEEIEHFRISGLDNEINDFSDDVMGDKTAEEMYREDMEKEKDQLEQDFEPQMEEYKKPEPPLYIKLTVQVLGRSLNFLPSKNRTRKLLVLEILKDGLEVIRDWEDDLLPIVHLIWSPFVGRFKEFEDPLVINFSFQLLVVLARLAKDFIRSRTVKEVLPSILEVLEKFAKNSYLKDRGSAYRYTQGYKLQLILLEQLGRVIVDLDMLEKDVNAAIDCVIRYLSSKQPIPLQNAAIEFFKTLVAYDPEPFNKKLESWLKQDEYKKNLSHIYQLYLSQYIFVNNK